MDRLAQFRYGTELPDNKEGEKFAMIIASHLREPVQIKRVLGEIAPWHDEDEVERLIRRVIRKQYRWRAATIARWLNVTWAEHEALGLRHIGSIDKPPSVVAAEAAERRAGRRMRDHRRRQRRRRENGSQPRADWLAANGISRAKEWEVLGMSRAKWYQLGKPTDGETGQSSRILASANGDTPVSRPAQAARPRPAMSRKIDRPGRWTGYEDIVVVKMPDLAAIAALMDIERSHL